MKTRSGADHLAAYKCIDAMLTQHGLKPQLQNSTTKLTLRYSNTCANKTWTSSSCRHTCTAATQQSVPSAPSKIISLPASAALNLIFLCSSGTNLCHKH